MSTDLNAMLRHKAINGWWLFWLVSIPMSALMVLETLGTDTSTAPGVSHLIGFSVRWAVPFIYIVIATSALQTLFPGPVPAWLLRNRKYVGLMFAVAMAWQGLFIYIMSTIHRDYYFEEIYFFRDELEGSTGYIFLAALVLTSFRFGRKYLDNRQWKLLHTAGVIYLWAYPFSVYWWNLHYYGNPQPIDYVFYWTGLTAFTLRIFAWGKKRRVAAQKLVPDSSTPMGFRILGTATIVAGLVVAATGLMWQDAVTTFLTGPEWSATLLLWLPYWPFEPFLSLVVIGAGVYLGTYSHRSYSLSLSR